MQHGLQQRVMWGCELPFPHSDPGFLLSCRSPRQRRSPGGPGGGRRGSWAVPLPRANRRPAGWHAGAGANWEHGNGSKLYISRPQPRWFAPDNLPYVLKDSRWNSTLVTTLRVFDPDTGIVRTVFPYILGKNFCPGDPRFRKHLHIKPPRNSAGFEATSTTCNCSIVWCTLAQKDLFLSASAVEETAVKMLAQAPWTDLFTIGLWAVQTFGTSGRAAPLNCFVPVQVSRC